MCGSIVRRRCNILLLQAAVYWLVVTSSVEADETIRAPPAILRDDSIKFREVVKEYSKIPCKATGIPRPTITWLKDDDELPHNGVEVKGSDITIAIDDCPGIYQCFAENEYGKSMSQMYERRKAVNRAVNANDKQRQVVGRLGESLKISPVAMETSSRPTYKWQIRSGPNSFSRIEPNKRIIIDLNGTLYFSYLRKGDELEEYQDYHLETRDAISDHSFGSSYTKIIILKENTTEAKTPILKLLYPLTKVSEITIIEGEKLQLNCVFGGIEDGDNDIVWTVGGRTVDASNYGTLLTIDDVTISDPAAYTCTAIQSRTGTSEAATINVKVETYPKFTVNGRPKYTNATEGKEVVFTCQTTQDTTPRAQITWLFNGEPISETAPRTEIMDIEYGQQLRIVDLRREDIKVVQCKVENKNRVIYADAPLNVLKQTRQIVSPSNAAISINKTVAIFNCSATTDPSTPLEIVWKRNNRTLGYLDDHDHLIQYEGMLIVNVSDLPEKDYEKYAGIYSCNATNTYSFDNANAKLEYIPSFDPTVAPLLVAESMWLIIIIIITVILLFIIILLCCICFARNKGEEYDVEAKELWTGNDPVNEEKVAGFHDYVRMPDKRRKDSRASLTSTVFFGSTCSLDDFAAPSERGMSEDGSFSGHYNDDTRRRFAN